MQLANKKWTQEEFAQQRKEVLATWPTGEQVDLEEALAYQKTIAPEKRFVQKLNDAMEKGITLIQPRAGVPLIEDHIKLLRHLETEGEADLLPTTIDSYTRLNRYTDAERGIKESFASGKAMLNGFPAVNHGVQDAARSPAPCRRRCKSAMARPMRACCARFRWPAGLPALKVAAFPIIFPTQKRIHRAYPAYLAVLRPAGGPV